MLNTEECIVGWCISVFQRNSAVGHGETRRKIYHYRKSVISAGSYPAEAGTPQDLLSTEKLVVSFSSKPRSQTLGSQCSKCKCKGHKPGVLKSKVGQREKMNVPAQEESLALLSPSGSVTFSAE